MSELYYSMNRLPDVEIYGGETSSWEIEFVKENYTPYDGNSIVGNICTMVFVPYGYVSGITDAESPVRIALTKTAVATRNVATGRVSATFNFTINDTLSLRGKYIYQIEIKQDTQLTLGHGSVFIRGNLNR